MESGSTGSLEAIIRSAADAIITAGADGRIQTWNPAAQRMFGYSQSEAVGQSLTLIVPPRFQEAHRTGLGRVVANR